MGRVGLEQRGADAEFRHAWRVYAWCLRYLEPWLPDVSGRDAQRDQPSLRDLRQRRSGHGEENSNAGRILAHLVSAESAAPDCELVAEGQQQLRRDGTAVDDFVFLAAHASLSRELLREEQAQYREAHAGRTCGVRDRTGCGAEQSHD